MFPASTRTSHSSLHACFQTLSREQALRKQATPTFTCTYKEVTDTNRTQHSSPSYFVTFKFLLKLDRWEYQLLSKKTKQNKNEASGSDKQRSLLYSKLQTQMQNKTTHSCKGETEVRYGNHAVNHK